MSAVQLESKEKAQRLLRLAEADEKLKLAERSLDDARARAQAAVNAVTFMRPGEVGRFLGRPTGWVVARRKRMGFRRI